MKKQLNKLHHNWRSGITVGLVSIPVAISLAVASHTSPLAGIITAFWAGLIASLSGGSNYNIIGPTGSLAGLLFVYASNFGPQCLPILAILSGVFIFAGYILRIERYLMFIPGSALHGFILGIACIIVCHQFNNACGLTNIPHRDNVVYALYESLKHITNIHLPSFMLFTGALALLLLFARHTPRLPGLIMVTPLGILIGYLSTNNVIPWPLATLGAKYHVIDASLIQLPSFHFRISYIFPALSIAAISILETMVSARIADGITKTKHNKQKEMVGLCFANIASGLAGGIPATAALARTALNIRSGSTHKVSATISSLCIGFISLLMLSLFRYLPLCIISSMLVFIAFRMLEMEHFFRMFRVDKKSFALSIIVAGITVYENVVTGILLGSVIATLLFMEKLSTGYHEIVTQHKPLQPQPPETKTSDTLIYTIKGPLAYINAQAHLARLERVEPCYTDIIINMREVYLVDLDGLETFGEIIYLLISEKKHVMVAGLQPVIKHLLSENNMLQKLYVAGCIFDSVDEALASMGTKPVPLFKPTTTSSANP